MGDAIRHSGLKREEIFVTTKLWVQDHEYDDTLRAFDLSMKKLGLDYLDLYLIHKPYGNYYAAWRAMERLYKEGRIRAIGVTSFSSERLQDLFLHNEIKPAVNQLETHPFFQQQAAHRFLEQEGIRHEAWAPFAEGQNDIFNNPLLKAIAGKYGKPRRKWLFAGSRFGELSLSPRVSTKSVWRKISTSSISVSLTTRCRE